MLITKTGANNRGTDQSTHSHSLKGMKDADPACSFMKSSVNNNCADQSAHLQSLEPTTEVEIPQLISKVLCEQ